MGMEHRMEGYNSEEEPQEDQVNVYTSTYTWKEGVWGAMLMIQGRLEKREFSFLVGKWGSHKA